MTFKPTTYDEDPLPAFGASHKPAASVRKPGTAKEGFARISAKAWLGIAMISLVLATGSAVVLQKSLNDSGKDQLVLTWESIPVFLKKTAHLTWQNIVSTGEVAGPAPTMRDDTAFHVAPAGLLDPLTQFRTLDTYADYQPRKDEKPMAPVAPLRLLDPKWSVSFSGAARD